jgi:uncharacterized protein (TIGR02145 family)
VPGSTVNFTAFNPCSNAVTGDYWYLTDTREASYNNTQTYKVKKMADGHIWMVQDMKFGNKCGTDFNSPNGSDQIDKVSSIGTYYGDCTAATNTDTPAARGYLYDWAATINKGSAYYGSSSDVGCSGTVTGTFGTAPGACQGICPNGWHIPTGNTSGEYQALHTAGGCATNNDDCWDANSAWEGVLSGACSNTGAFYDQGSGAYYWTSTYLSNSYAYLLNFNNGHTYPATSSGHTKNYGRSVRCVRNY